MWHSSPSAQASPLFLKVYLEYKNTCMHALTSNYAMSDSYRSSFNIGHQPPIVSENRIDRGLDVLTDLLSGWWAIHFRIIPPGNRVHVDPLFQDLQVIVKKHARQSSLPHTIVIFKSRPF